MHQILGLWLDAVLNNKQSQRFLVEQLQGFIMLLPTWIDKHEAAAIGGVARKREDLIIVNIDEASRDDELAVAEYAEDIYKVYKLTEVMINFFSLFHKQKFTLRFSK
ncbi:hypothetical protein Dimus_024959 [Dionaea muscipula]